MVWCLYMSRIKQAKIVLITNALVEAKNGTSIFWITFHSFLFCELQDHIYLFPSQAPKMSKSLLMRHRPHSNPNGNIKGTCQHRGMLVEIPTEYDIYTSKPIITEFFTSIP